MQVKPNVDTYSKPEKKILVVEGASSRLEPMDWVQEVL